MSPILQEFSWSPKMIRNWHLGARVAIQTPHSGTKTILSVPSPVTWEILRPLLRKISTAMNNDAPWPIPEYTVCLLCTFCAFAMTYWIERWLHNLP